MNKIASILKSGEKFLKDKGVSEPKLSAQWILSEALNFDRLEMPASPKAEISESRARKFNKMLAMRAEGLSLSHIFGRHNFMGIELSISRKVLVPRPETEQLVELVSKFVKNKEGVKILDFGAGSGAIAVALALKFSKAEITAADKSKAALDCARKNILKNGLSERVKTALEDSVKKIKETFDIIVSNPPYIPENVINGLDIEVRLEPKMALSGGIDGLKIIKALLIQSPQRLKKNGMMFLEIGENQKDRIEKLALKKWHEIKFYKDYNNKYRFFSGVRPT